MFGHLLGVEGSSMSSIVGSKTERCLVIIKLRASFYELDCGE